jgi:hypothetical protein
MLLLGARHASAAGISITSVTPPKGPAAAQIVLVINGAGFPSPDDCDGPVMSVTVDGLSAFPLELPTATQVRVLAPLHPPGTVDVTVKNLCDGSSATLAGAYTYLGSGILSGGVPDEGFGLFVFGGGTNYDLVEAVDCAADTLTFWATNEDGDFVTYIPGAIVEAANAAWNALFPDGIPPNTALIGRCT